MSTKLGTLTLDLVTRTAGFTAPIKTAEKQTVTSFDAMKKSVLTYGAIAVSGAAAVGAGVLAMANEYANAARELQTFASISNTTTQEFQRMAVGAETMGISSEKLSDQLKDFNEKLGEFITIGSGGAIDFFEQIAIKTEGSAEGARKLALEMQNLSGPKALQLYVDKLEEAGVTQQQMSFYLESMASDTTNLIPLLRDGGKGFEYWADAAERAGVIMDEYAIEKANELRVQMDLLNLQVQGVKNQFIQGLMPALVSVGDGLSDATMQTNLMSDAGETLGEVFKGVAATGMGVYAVVKMLSNSIAGLAAQAVQSKQMVDKAAEGRGILANLPGVKALKALTLGVANARTNPDSAVQMAAQDNAQVADDVANSINRIYNDAVNQSVSAMAKIQNSQVGVTKGSDEWIKKQNEAAKATKENTKAQNELNKAIELGNRLIYDFGDEQLRISEDLKKDLADIQSAALKPDAKARYTTLAQMQADARKKLYIADLDFELNEHNSTEERKLADELRINKLRLDAQRGLNKNEIELRKQALDERYAMELQQARFHAQNVQQTMRDSIKGLSYGVDEIFAQATMSPQDYDRWSLENDRSNSQLGLKNERVRVEQDIMTSDAYSTDDERYDALLEAHQEYRDGMAAIDVDYNQKTKDLDQEQFETKMQVYSQIAGMTAQTFDQMAGMLRDSVGESNALYKAMFLAGRAASLAQAVVNTEEGATKALAQGGAYGSLLAGVVRATGYASVGLIAGQTIAGMAHDGIDNIPKEGTWLLDKGERVVDSRTNGDLKDFIANGGSAPNVNVYTLPGETADVSWDNGQLDVRIRKIAKEEAKTPWSELNNPNSYSSKQIQRNTTAGVKR